MRRGAFEIQAVAGLEQVMTLIVEPNLKFSAHDVQKFLAFMGIRFAASPAGLDAKEMRFHGGVAPGEELHADFGAGFENFALGRTDQDGSIAVGFEEGDDVGFVETSDAA